MMSLRFTQPGSEWPSLPLALPVWPLRPVVTKGFLLPSLWVPHCVLPIACPFIEPVSFKTLWMLFIGFERLLFWGNVSFGV